ncbi:MAG: cation diffusion facilitator family transporter [Pyrinomonadaceae bacterium]|nr:cation diffusion facilitator family transporter [Pyrinomonadaceae bacterium]
MGSNCDHRNRNENLRRVKVALGLIFVYMLIEILGGYFANSLALLADATHMFTDLVALLLTLAAFWFASKPASPEKTYGYYRLEILAAFINGVFLVSISLFVIYQAHLRFKSEIDVKGDLLTSIAFGGLLVNLVCAYILHSGSKDNLNLRGAWLHVVADALGSIAAILAGVLIVFFGWFWADAAMSLVISLIIIYGAWNLIRDSVNVLIEATPSHINLKEVKKTILETEKVKDVHDLHVWTITSGIYALSVHVVYEEGVSQRELLKKVCSSLREKFGIGHLTIQMETEGDSFCLCTFENGHRKGF